jgi:ABC-2 type transport system ATP-binding protein
MPKAVTCKNLRKTYSSRPPVEAVAGLDLEIKTGECFGLLGPNGAGKTTTVEILEGILAPTSGDVEVLGLHWDRDEKVLREKLGISLQETRFADKLTVAETITLFSSFYQSGRPAADVMDEVGLSEKAGSWVVNLSGGQKQRLAVACALVGDPELLFLDEPSTGLDPQSRRQIWDIIRDHRSRGRTIILTTHYMDEAEKLCDNLAVVDHGKLIAQGSPAQLIASLQGEHVIEFSLNGSSGDAGRSSEDDPILAPQRYATLPSVLSARIESDGFQLTVEEPHVAIPALMKHLAETEQTLSRLTTRHASLEDVFVALTGRHLRDE